jgi:DNA modification methylase
MKTLDSNSVNCIITSPPYYGLRDYGMDNQIGLEQSPDEYVNKLVEVFRECKRVLKDDGTLWLNLGDSYAGNGINGVKPKDLIGIPWMVAFALRADGWYLRSEIIWAKNNCMPESVKDRPTKSHEQIFLFSKTDRYFYDGEKVKTPTKGPAHDNHAQTARKRLPTKIVNGIRREGFYPNANLRDVWWVSTTPFKEAHFATFPEDLIRPCIIAGCPEGGTILDPFNGAGTTGVVATKNNRNYIGIDLNPEYIKMSEKRIQDAQQQMRLPI